MSEVSNDELRRLNERVVSTLGIGSYSLVDDVALLVRLPGEENSRRFSPAMSIEDAMGLLEMLPSLIGWWTVSYCMVNIHSGEDQPRFSVDVTVSYGMDTGRTRTQAITEAFIAAMEASNEKSPPFKD